MRSLCRQLDAEVYGSCLISFNVYGYKTITMSCEIFTCELNTILLVAYMRQRTI